MILKCNIPGLFHDVAETIQHEGESDLVAVNELACRMHQLRVDLLKWYSSYELLVCSGIEILPGSPEYDCRCKTFAIYLSCVILVNRLLGALSPSDREELENETQMLADHMLALEVEIQSISPAVSIFVAQELAVSRAMIGSSKYWLIGEYLEIGNYTFNVEQRVLVAPWKFESWNTALGKKK
jgi:hypothetical protein